MPNHRANVNLFIRIHGGFCYSYGNTFCIELVTAFVLVLSIADIRLGKGLHMLQTQTIFRGLEEKYDTYIEQIQWRKVFLKADDLVCTWPITAYLRKATNS